MTDPTPTSLQRVAPYVTNLDRPVFCLRNLPEEVVAALLAQYSRSTRGLREALADYLADVGADAPAAGTDPLARAARRATVLHEKYTLGFGHASIADHATVHVCVEGCSILAAKVLEDPRLAGFTEKSTRYVAFSVESYLDPVVAGVPAAAHDAYAGALEARLGDYAAVTRATAAWLHATYARPDDQPEAAWARAVQAKAFDMCRGLLPAGAPTALGITMNARELAHSLCKWSTHDLPEVRALAAAIRAEAAAVVPTLLKYSDVAPQRDAAAAAVRALRAVPPAEDAYAPLRGGEVRCRRRPADAARRVAVAVHREVYGTGRTGVLTPREVDEIVAAYVAGHTQHNQPGRALEAVAFEFEVVMDFGAWRDLQRHRMLTPDAFPRLTTDRGFYTPAEFAADPGSVPARAYRAALDRARADGVRATDPAWRQYLVPLAANLRWGFRDSLRNLYYLCERRTGRECHPSYRAVAQQIAAHVGATLPALRDAWLVDTRDYPFARLQAATVDPT